MTDIIKDQLILDFDSTVDLTNIDIDSAVTIDLTPYTSIADVITDREGKLVLNSEKADIEINGVSLSDTLAKIERRLAILQTNPELESEFEQLKLLGEQYRELEKRLLEQKQMWQALGSD